MQRGLGRVGVLGLAAVMASCGDAGTKHLPDAPDVDARPPAAMLTIDRSSVSFGSISLGAISPGTTFTITNTGAEASGALATALTGADAASFAVGTNTCTGTLGPAATCQVAVTFSPLATGTKAASLMVMGMPGGTVAAALDGEGIGLGALTISSSVSEFGSVVAGQTGTIVATFTVTNTGTGTSGALSVIPAGSDPADFVKGQDTCATTTLAAAATCTFEVRIAPLSAGAKAALFQVSATPGGSVSGAVTGTGLAPASLRAVPLQLEFGSVVTSQTSATLTVTVASLGGVPTGSLVQSITGTDAGMFVATAGTCSGTMLAAGTTCTVTVAFTPTSVGAKSAQLVLAGTPGGTVATSLVGDGITGNQLSITPSAHGYPNTNVGQVAAAQQFTITNNAAGASGPLTAVLGGGDASQYQMIAGSDGCTGTVLAPSASCAISVAFAPTMGGVAHASLTVAGSPGGSVTAGLLGLGVSAASLSMAPPSRGFGSVVTGTMSPPLAFTITNLGGQVSGVPSAMLTGAGAAQFAIAGNTCTATLAPGAACTVQVRFAPTTTGAATAALSVSATPGGTVMGTLSGDGIAAGGLVMMPSSTTFPVTSVGDIAAAQVLTVQNTGSAATGTIVIATTGADFASTNTCATLAPGATCTISVTFSPTAIGARTGSVSATASPGGTATAALAGSGRPRLEILALDSGPVVDPADLGTAIINNPAPHDVQILVRNNTATTKAFGITPAFGSPAQYAVVLNTCGSTIGAAGGLCTVGVRFAPTTTGTKPGSITFDIGAGAANQATQNLTGVGIDSLTITALAGTDFESVPINTTPGALTFRVTNPAGSATSGAITAMLAGGAAYTITADACTGQTLAAGASCLIDVSFSPTTVAAAMTTLSAMATPGGMPFINITGTGVSPTGNPPTDLTLSPSSIAEGTPSGSTVGTLATTDADASDTFLYTFVGGTGDTDNAAFSINGAMVQTNGVFDYETRSGYAIRVRVTDSGGNIFEKPLTVTVTNVDEAPVAVDDSRTLTEDDPATAIDVLANDTDIDGGPKMINSVTQPANGTVVVTGGGTGLTYQPNPNFAGGDTFIYTLNGGSLATVAITVTAVDDAPVASDDSFTIPEDNGPTQLDVLANDTDVDGGPISITAVTQPAHGTLVITGAGTGVAYTAAMNYGGPDSFTYTLSPGGSIATVTLMIDSIDDPPVAVDDSAATFEDAGPAFVDVLANDTDPDGGPEMVASFTQGAHGTVAAFQNGVTYQPMPNYFGTDTFTYILNGGSVGTVTFIVNPVNDAPSFTKGADRTVLEDSGLHTVTGWATMTSAGPANEASQTVDFIVTNDNNPLFSVQPAISPAGSLTYTLAADANGMATVTVQLHDDGGTAFLGVDTGGARTFAINVTAVNDVPSFTRGVDQTLVEDAGAQSVTGWATSISAGAANESAQALDFTLTNDNAALFSVAPAVAADGTLTYTPAANANGTANLTIKLHDIGGTANGGVDTSATQSFTITVTSVNDAPPFTKGADQTVLEDSGAATVVGWAASISAGPSDESGQTLDFIVVNNNSALFSVQPAIAANGTLTFTPAANASGSATVTVQLHDSGGTANGGADTSAAQTFAINVTAVNDAPSITSTASTTATEDTLYTNSATSSDVDGPGATWSLLGTHTCGGSIGAATGVFAFTSAGPVPPASCVVAIQICDGGTPNLCAQQMTTVDITAVNDAPAITNTPPPTATEDTVYSYTATFGDPDGTGHTWSVDLGDTCGGLIDSATGVYAFTPAGPVPLPSCVVAIKVCDGGAQCGAQSAVVSITAVNDPPAASDQAVTAGISTAVALTLVAVDPDGDPLSYVVGVPTHGTLTGAAPNLTYTPTAGYLGSDSFSFHANDGLVDSNTATVTISVIVPPCANLSYVAVGDYGTAAGPHAVAIADLNGDGKLDLVVAAKNGNAISSLLGNGNGTFQAKQDYATGPSPLAIALGDLNGDNKPDAVVANRLGTGASVLFGNGDGSFAPRVDYGTGAVAYALALGDLNGDGKLDIVVANLTPRTASVLINNGNGTFQSAVDYATGSSPNGVAIGDVDGDSVLDVVVANRDSNSVSFFRGNGNGTLQAKVDTTVGALPRDVALGDLNDDQKLDVVVANRNGVTASLLIGNGDGTFQAQSGYGNSSSLHTSVALADLDSNGTLDTVVTNRNTNDVSMLLGTGVGTLGSPVNTTTGVNPHGVAIGDLTGDGRPDVVTANRSANTVRVLRAQCN